MLFTIVLVGGYSIYKEKQILGQLNDVTSVQLPAVRSMTLADMMHDGLRGVVYSALVAAQKGRLKDLKQIQEECSEKSETFEKYLNELESLNLKKETKGAIVSAKPKLNNYIASARELVSLAETNPKAASERLDLFNENFTALEVEMEALGDLIMRDAFAVRSQGEDAVRISIFLTCIGGALSFLFSLFIVKGLVSKMVGLIRQLSLTSGELTSVSDTMNSSSQNLSNSSHQSASALEQASASLTELTAMIKRTAENTNLINETSKEHAEIAEKGDVDMQKFVHSIDEVNANSKKMEEIINVIDDIAFQTNLLALNAAVEAARAGEQGKGFAVVAEAVRNLAQRSAGAAKDINTIIKENIQQIQNSAEAASRSGQEWKKIVGSAKETSGLINEVQQAIDQQVAGLNEISRAINELEKMTQTNVQETNYVATSAQKMATQSDSLSGVVQFMQVQVLNKYEDAA
ncbi:MAG: hypothetical protein A4S09_03170 [Proteobacteria bacterium SG_bin7]|nr:MAG: hypothetical protein A4S09_03170 [Proteobacteria bacterium SG_bin7]